MADYPQYSEKAVQEALDSAKKHYDGHNLKSASGLAVSDGHLATHAECISVTIGDGKACINLPLGFGSVCIPVPISYDGKVAEACLDICTTWGVPTGVKVSIVVAGVTIASQTFGKC